jgi:hypothetical protein
VTWMSGEARKRIESGTVGVTACVNDLGSPFGGIKNSGIADQVDSAPRSRKGAHRHRILRRPRLCSQPRASSTTRYARARVSSSMG